MNRNKQTEILGGIITAIILILLIFLSNVETNKLTYLESVASAIVNPIQRITTDIKNKIPRHLQPKCRGIFYTPRPLLRGNEDRIVKGIRQG